MKKLIHILDKDKRKRKRIELFSNLPAKIEALGKTIVAKIKDVSYNGIGIIISPDEEFPTMQSLETKLELHNQSFQGKIANRIVLPNQEIQIGLALPAEATRSIDFNNTDSTWDKVTDLETIKSIYQDLAFKGYETPVEIRQDFSGAIAFPVKLTESESIIFEIDHMIQGNIERGKVKCIFDLFNTCHAFDSNIEKINQNMVEIKLSSPIARLLRRETVRIQKKNANFEINVKLTNIDLDTVIEEYEVFDYSEHGISMLDPDGDLSLPRSLQFNDAVIEVKGIGIILGKAEVRSYQWNRDMNSYIVGLKFEPYQEPHLTNWHNLVLKARYPNLDFEYREQDHSKIWDLFDRSKYLGLKSRESFSSIVNFTKDAWEKLKIAGSDISIRVMIKEHDKIMGHLQMDRIYPNTWCANALAIDPEKFKIVGRDIYSVTSDIFSSSKESFYTISITESELSWNKKNYYDFVKNYEFPEHNELKIFQVHEVEIKKGWNLNSDQNITIREANKFDRIKIVKYFELYGSEIERKALSLDIDNLDLALLDEKFKKHGLSRSRSFYVAYDKNEFLGFACIETGTTGICVLGIQDTLYTYCFPHLTAEQKQTVRDSLINESLKFYRDRDVPCVNVYIEDEKREYYTEKGVTFLWEGARWITKSDTAKRFHCHIQALYGHLLLKRERIRKKNHEK